MEILERLIKEKLLRKQLIKEFQEFVWNGENTNEILSELAYDLDFYEPNKKWEKEDINYFGDDKLEEEILIDRNVPAETLLGIKWDGRLHGEIGNNNGYIWLCNFQLEGEVEVVKKGTFVLIR